MSKTIAVHEDVLEMLAGYAWPGNVRELENVVERAVTLNTTGVLTPSDFDEQLHQSQKLPTLFPRQLVSLEEIQRQYILHVLERLNGNMSRAAELLEIDRRTLYRMLERFGVKAG